MIFRDYVSGDFEPLNDLWNELDMGSPERGDSSKIILETIEMGGKLIVVEEPETGRIIGSSWMTFDGRRIYLHHFGIIPAFQRQGLGTRLAYQSLAFIKEKGYQVKLEVHKENLAAKSLYEKLGFFAFTDYDIYMMRKTKNISIPENLH